MKKVLITGINGQDGSYLAELLLERGDDVYGVIRPDAQLAHIEPIAGELSLIEADITNAESIAGLVKSIQPNEIYNLAAQSHVRQSFDEPVRTAQVTGIGALNVFEAARLNAPAAKLYQASSSEMFGDSIDPDGFQRETTPMKPASPYACSKVFAYLMARNYRDAYRMFISNGILFNHESPRRPTNFVTSKICHEAVRIKLGLTDKMQIGNLDAERDWGHSKDFVKAMWLMLQQDTPDDFVCATGIPHSVRQLVEYVFGRLDLDWRQTVEVDATLLRREQLKPFKGDSTKLRQALNWQPEYTFETMLDEMIEYWQTELADTDTAAA